MLLTAHEWKHHVSLGSAVPGGGFMRLMPQAVLSVVPESQWSVQLDVFNKAIKV